MMNWVLVFIGGGVGSLFRFGIGKLFNLFWAQPLPLATLLSNILATATLGFVTLVIAQKQEMPTELKSLILIGFCGGFSTFSTFSMETFLLFKHNLAGWAIANIAASVTLCLAVLYFLVKHLTV